jgi:hypothetical protein
MEKMRALVANDPRVYREVISDALKRLSPMIEVSTAEPEDLDQEVARLRPHLVICSRISPAARAGCQAWLVLYPEGKDRAEIGCNGGEHTALVEGVGVRDLLSVVDETELLRRSSDKDEVRSSRTVSPRSEIGRAGSKPPRRAT